MREKLASVDWVSDILVPVTVILMEAVWIYPWLMLMGKWSDPIWQRPPLNLASVILLSCASFLVVRLFFGRKWPLYLIRLSIITCGLGAIFIVIRIEYSSGFGIFDALWFVNAARSFIDILYNFHPAVIAALIGIVLWWRGISHARTPIDRDHIYTSFLFGLAALVLLIIVWGSGDREGLSFTIGLYVPSFFLFGLTALALINVHSVREDIAKRGIVQGINRRWIFIMLITFVVVGGIILIGTGITSAFSVEISSLTSKFTRFVTDTLLSALNYLLIPLYYIGMGLYYAFQFLVNLFRREPGEPFQPPDFFEDQPPEEIEPLRGLSAEAIMVIQWVLVGLVIIVVIFILARSITRYLSARTETGVEVIHEGLWSWKVVKEDLLLFLRLFWRRFKRNKEKTVHAVAMSSRFIPAQTGGMLQIREIYRHLLSKASRTGAAHRGYETPYEYADRLGEAVPDGSTQLDGITDLYVGVRYGDTDAADEEIKHANVLWRALSRIFGSITKN